MVGRLLCLIHCLGANLFWEHCLLFSSMLLLFGLWCLGGHIVIHAVYLRLNMRNGTENLLV